MVILGFGCTEHEEAKKIIHKCLASIATMPDEPVKAVKAVRKEYDGASKLYKEMDNPPQRYTYFFFTLVPIYEGSYHVEFTMHHINRRHPFSPDGWALLITHWMISVSPDEDPIIYKEA